MSSAIGSLVIRMLAAAGLAGAASAPAVAQNPNVLRVKQVHAMDNSGFEKPLPAFSMLVPYHWNAEGGVVWNPQDRCNSSGYNFAFKAASPDNAFGVTVLPTVSWSAQYGMPPVQGACPSADLRSARAFLEWYVGRITPGAQVLDFRGRPDLLKDYASFASRTPLPGGAYSETAVDAGEVLVAFTDNGRDMRGVVAAVVILWHTHFPGSPSMMAGVPSVPDMDDFGGSSLPAFGAFAPVGKLDTRTAEMIRKSLQPGAEWSRRIAEHHAVLSRQNQKGATDRHNIRMRTSREIGEMINRGYQDRSETQERGHREFIESIRGVETYDDPYHGGTVQLDNSYDHAWQLNDGSYVLTDDPSFDPYATFGRDGQQLKVTR